MDADSSPPRTCVVAGNGMVGVRFCELLRERDPRRRWRVVVCAEEPRPAYDRIKLSKLLGADEQPDLTLRPADWYESVSVELRLADSVTRIDADRRQVATASGRLLSYDALVLATGAAPVVPPIPGIDDPSVATFRTAADAESLRARVGDGTRVVVIGGGLLGLEAAAGCRALGATVSVVERARYPLSQQLDEQSAQVLQRCLEKRDVQLKTDCRVEAIERRGHQLVVRCRDEAPMPADLVIVAAGVRPRDELAAAGQLAVSVRGGFLVDEHLQTSVPDIYAIGDCAAVRGEPCGLVAPGYEMARVVAHHLTGGSERLTAVDRSCRLSIDGVAVAAIGDATRDGRQVAWANGDRHRSLTVEGGRIVAARGVGDWPGLAQVQDAIERGRRISDRQLAAFERTGELGRHPLRAVELPPKALVCHCAGVRRDQIDAVVATQGANPAAVAAATRASTFCGTCAPLVAQLCGQVEQPAAPPTRALIAISLAVAASCAAIVSLGPLPFADSVTATHAWLSDLWREPVPKQTTGFALVGVATAGMALSLRKRVSWFRRGRFSTYRLLHAAAGLACAVLVVAHTGMHFGANLNRWLMVAFVATLLTGAFLGVVCGAAAGPNGPRATWARRVRPPVTWAHLLFLWLLPVLIGFHVFAVYYF